MDKVNQILIAVLALVAIVIASVGFVNKQQDCQCVPCQCGPCDCSDCDDCSGDTKPSGSLPINKRKLNEIKRGDCPTCPTVVVRPTVVSKPVAKVDPLHQVKTGTWKCGKCGAKKCGAEFHTFWTVEDEPITPCCQACWNVMSNEQRKEVVAQWAKSNKASESAIRRWVAQVQ